MHPAADFAIAKVYVITISITEKEESGRLVKKSEQKMAFLFYTVLFSRAGENGECGGVKLPGRVECTLWTTVWRHILWALGSPAMWPGCGRGAHLVLPLCSWLLAVGS